MEEFVSEGKALIRSMVEALVDSKDDVQVEHTAGENTSVFTIKVAKENIGQVLGKRGANVRALRHIVNAFSTKHKRRSVIDIHED